MYGRDCIKLRQSFVLLSIADHHFARYRRKAAVYQHVSQRQPPWANAARKKKIPLSVISEGMGDTFEMTTRIYLSSLDAGIIDRANKKIMRLL